MAKFEKLVVLTVLFVAAVILAFSLNRGKDEVEAAGPLSSLSHVREIGSPPVQEQMGPALGEHTLGLEPEGAPAATAPGANLLLNAGVEDKAGVKTSTGVSAPGAKPHHEAPLA